MDWWLLHYTEVRANPDNRTFSMDTVPRVPFFYNGPSVPFSSYNSETGESGKPLNSGVSLQFVLLFKIQLFLILISSWEISR